jgi:hypothetical protein
MNEIFETTSGFYYINEEGEEIGPFSTYQQAEVAYSASLRWLAKDEQQEIRKIKDEGM